MVVKVRIVCECCDVCVAAICQHRFLPASIERLDAPFRVFVRVFASQINSAENVEPFLFFSPFFLLFFSFVVV